ncbi:hypothetical protein [Pseudomonas sp. GM30]|uniref:hypothetical protein n=1 Tax=Pseudomonas sp. GM30 TaxID=1144328 RepID=UPI0002700360|nr:hypothetical protein [Pseudomonas sp. GM30]EUB84582.1 hypothetical protein PMI25_000959 [Pseudomonas sp. GM30]
MPDQTPLDFNPPEVIGVEDPDIDPDGHIPQELLLTGIDVVVPLWPDHATDPGDRDLLTVYFELPRQPIVEIQTVITPADIKSEFIVHIDAVYLQLDGIGQLWYQVMDTADNPSPSKPRNLTIDHTPIPRELEEPRFLDANINGYLSCSTQPPLWEGIRVRIPPLMGYQREDRLELFWRAYPASWNASGLEYTRARKKFTPRLLSNTDISSGYEEAVLPYDVHVKPLVTEASATLQYRIYRGRKLIGVSKVALVKIDRIISGEPLPCGP